MPIDLSLTPENLLVQESVRDFVAREVAPNIRAWDQAGGMPRRVFDQMGQLGYLGAPIWERWGGAGMDYTSLGILCEELERADTALRVVMSVHVALNSLTLMQWANPEQQDRWLVPQARGEKLATFGLTEPGAGTDVAAITTTATRDGDAYILNGAKMWISLADIADHFLVFASVDRTLGHRGITAFVLERGTPGLSTGTISGKMGIHAGTPGRSRSSRRTGGQRIGEEGEGFGIQR